MSVQSFGLLPHGPAKAERKRPLGRHLVDRGIISQAQLLSALRLQLRLQAPIGEILVAEGYANSDQILDCLGVQNGLARADLSQHAPDRALAACRTAQFWLRHGAVPWMRLGGSVLIATTRPDKIDALRADLNGELAGIVPVLASEPEITAAISSLFAEPLARGAGCRVDETMSCRTWAQRPRAGVPAALLALAAGLVFMPALALGMLSLVAIATLGMLFVLKLCGFAAFLLAAPETTPPPLSRTALPKVSVLVPLFREKEIVAQLVARLEKLSYPKVLLDVLLVLEEHDTTTRRVLDRTPLPPWIRIIEVPAHGGLTTKPRAMNYALDFCRGDIIGVWDAEDAPAHDQIERVVTRFQQAPEDVVCLQGVLDYYNPRSNWMARCFTIEYASWFRVILPGIASLGLIVPLGGTTLFFKRGALEDLGGWDAHNVTEDADLGVRLCRAGFRTEVIDTVTYEEANCRIWPWIKQRSRWLKGFMVTYLVHMRRPAQLWRELGALRFISLQAFFVGTLCQFLLAPVLWSFWLIIIGLDHPIRSMLPVQGVAALSIFFIAAEGLTLLIGMIAISRSGRPGMMAWLPSMILYFPLGALAAYKALYELVFRPYYWDKTQHGQAAPETVPRRAG